MRLRLHISGLFAAAIACAACNPSQSSTRSGETAADSNSDELTAEVSRGISPAPIAGTKLNADNGRGIVCHSTTTEDVCIAQTDKGPATGLGASTSVKWSIAVGGSATDIQSASYVSGGAGVRIGKSERAANTRVRLGVTTAGKSASFEVALSSTTSVYPAEAMHLTFDDSVFSSARDISGNNNTAVTSVSGVVANVAGSRSKTGTAFAFDSRSFDTHVASSPTLNFRSSDAGLSVAVWINSVTTGFQSLIDKRDYDSGVGYHIALDTRGVVFQLNGSTSGDGDFRYYGSNYLDGQWHQLILSVDFASKRAHVYVDGSVVHMSNSSGLSDIDISAVDFNMDNDAPFRIGQNYVSSQFPFKGRLDEMIVFRGALTSDQANALYQSYQ